MCRLLQEDVRRILAQKSRDLRPLASRLCWHSLLRPERKALAELLFLLENGLRDTRAARQSNWGCDASEPAEQRGSAPDKESWCSQASRARSDQQFSTSFLISGNRGCGKTTVVLSAIHATRSNQDAFFRVVDRWPDPDRAPNEVEPAAQGVLSENEVEKRLRDALSSLRQEVFWLPVLDVGMLAPGTSLLTAVLTSVGDALSDNSASTQAGLEYARAAGRRGPTPALLREEGVEDAWMKVAGLVRDATLMWEPRLDASDSLHRVDLQTRAVETAANLRRDFGKAVDAVALSLQGGSYSKPPVLILPIDNVDRSAEHASQILRLITTMNSPSLWYLLIGDVNDFSVFIERAQRTSLKIVPSGAPASSEEVVEAIARRQAAASFWAALPSAHRIQVGLVQIEEALTFAADPMQRNLRFYLKRIPVLWRQGSWGKAPSKEPTSAGIYMGDTQPPSGQCQAPRLAGIYVGDTQLPCEQSETQLFIPNVLYDMFVLDRFLGGQPKEKEAGYSFEGRLALTLPVRHLVDLWQAARHFHSCAHPDSESKKDEKPSGQDVQGEGTNPSGQSGLSSDNRDGDEYAIELAHYMLESTLKESEIPLWASQYLLNELLHLNSKERICLRYSGGRLRYGWTMARRLEVELPSGVSRLAQRTRVRAMECEGCTCSVSRPTTDSRERSEGGSPSESLPAHVAGWLMLLHDLLAHCSETRIDGEDDPFQPASVAETEHDVWFGRGRRVGLVMKWPMPAVRTFLGHCLLAERWRHQLTELKLGDLKLAAQSKTLLLRNCYVESVRWLCDRWSGDNNLRSRESLEELCKGANGDRQLDDLLRRMTDPYDANSSSWRRIAYDWLCEGLPLLKGPEFCGVKEDLVRLGSEKPELDKSWEKGAGHFDIGRYERGLNAIRDGLKRGDISVKDSRQLAEMCDRWIWSLGGWVPPPEQPGK